MCSENNNNNVSNDEAIRVLLIDLENCPNSIHQLMKTLEQFSQVVICYAQSGAKVPLDWVMPLTATVNENKLKIIKMPNSGKNAADFGISFWAGVMMEQLPSHTQFFIVSEDTGLDHVVGLLKSQSRFAERISTKSEEKPEASPTAAPQTPMQEYCAYLIKHSKNRPSKTDTLLNSIRTKFKENIVSAEKVLEELRQKGAIVIADKKVSYNDQKIIAITRQ